MGAVSLSKIYSLISECIVAPLLYMGQYSPIMAPGEAESDFGR